MNLDLYFFNVVNGHAKKSKILDFLAVFCAEYLGYALLVLLFFYAITIGQWQLFFIPLLAGTLSRLIINEIIYVFYRRQRPIEVLPITSLIKKPSHPSFPSGHASFFFGISFALLLFSTPLAIVGIIASALICLARIFCGVHWPSDIAGGIISAGIIFFIFQQIT